MGVTPERGGKGGIVGGDGVLERGGGGPQKGRKWMGGAGGKSRGGGMGPWRG